MTAREEMEALVSAHGFLTAAGLHDEADCVAMAIKALRSKT